jgi:hypothetical protein
MEVLYGAAHLLEVIPGLSSQSVVRDKDKARQRLELLMDK